MTLTRLKTPEAAARWLRAGVTGTLRTDSRQVQPGDGFIAWPGLATDGRQYARMALVAGAAVCLVEHEGVDSFAFDSARIASLPRLKASTGTIADAFFDAPSDALDVLAVTGTNGKTSAAWWAAQALTALGRRCGVAGTLGIGEPPLHATPAHIQATGLTTPDPVALQAALRRFVNEGFSACAVEASSIGLAEHRLAGTRVAVAMYTNFTQDHLDYHGDMQAYWQAKRALFDWPGLRAAVINVDDPHGAVLAEELRAEGRLEVCTCSVEGEARLRAAKLSYSDGGLMFDLFEGPHAVRVRTRLIGDYNVANLLAVLGALRVLGVSPGDAARVMPLLTPVPGRMQRVALATEPGASAPALPEVVVDYAHTPDALEKALGALRPLAATRGGRLLCVIGCGGNRDTAKRPLMAAIAERLADRVLLTSDNPRDEDPTEILREMAAGLVRRDTSVPIEDRRAAIVQAVQEAAAQDVVLIAGKGHEDYQEIAGVRHPFSDVDEAQAALQQRGQA